MSDMGEADSTKSLRKDVGMTFLNVEFVLSKQHSPRKGIFNQSHVVTCNFR